MIPYLNLFLKSLTQKTYKKLLIILFILLTIIPSVCFHTDFFRIKNGYSPFWLIYIYMIGAYIKLYGIKLNIKKNLIYAILSLLCALVLNVLISIIGLYIFKKEYKTEWFIDYISPFNLIASIGIFLLFIKIRISNKNINNMFKYLSEASFSVYIIHSHKLIYDYLITDSFIFLNKYNIFTIIFAIIVSMIGIYIICTVIDLIRKAIFKLFKIDDLINKLGGKLEDKLEI